MADGSITVTREASMEELRKSVAELLGEPADWPDHGNAPLAIAATMALLLTRKDDAYTERNRCVALVARMAVAMGLPVAVTKTAIDGWSEDWHGCIYIGLPTGQVSWHFHDSQAHLFAGLPQQHEDWDGHDTPEKYRRVDAAFRA